MEHEVVIPARFNGPPGSGHGGYSAGLAASPIDGPAEVSLRRPPPLEQTMVLRSGPDGAELLDGDDVVATARPVDGVDAEVPAPVSLEQAERAAGGFAWRGRHPFPTCYACGPEREPGD